MGAFSQYAQPDEVFYRTTLEGMRYPRGSKGGGDAKPFRVSAWTPENFSISSSAHYEAKLGGGIASLIQSLNPFARATSRAGGILGQGWDKASGLMANGGAAAFFGVSDVTQEMTFQTWVSSEPISFNLPLLFNAEFEAYGDVYANLLELLKLTLPWNKYLGKFKMLAGPGISYYDALKPGNQNIENVSLTIGKRIFLPIVLVDNVTIEWDTLSDAKGNYISGRADVSMRTPFVATRDNIDDWFALDPEQGRNRQTYRDVLNGTNMELARDAVEGVAKLFDVRTAIKDMVNIIPSGGR
jgi:hypothetical protein